VRPDRLAETQPAWIGTGAVSSHADLDEVHLWLNAKRFEGASTHNLPAYAGLTASVRWLLDDVGMAWATARAAALADRALVGLGTLPGVEVVTPPSHAPLVCFKVIGMAPPDVTKRLAEERVVARSIADTGVVRFATGFYNTEAEIDRAIELVGQIAAGRSSAGVSA
jgi:selenocysteine lyase/cysteine desulfurase